MDKKPKSASSVHPSFSNRIVKAVKTGLKPAIKTAIWLLKITIPLSLAVTLLGYFGVVSYIADFLNPVFSLMGLPGEASLVFITSIFLNIYSVIAVMAQLPLTVREITILAVMCLIAHNLFVETAVQAKTGSKAWQIVLLRLSMAIFSAFLLNWALPSQMKGIVAAPQVTLSHNFAELMIGWVKSASLLTLKIVVLVTLLMVLQEILKEFGVIKILSKIFSPLLRLFGLPQSTSFLWIVANILGLAYGSAVMVAEVNNGTVSRRDADLLNYHIAISHSNLEDLLLFVAIGAPVMWLLLPRLIIAALAVWGRRWALSRKKSSVMQASG
ncbi:MAG: nucleoside recognition domain-containing protein [Bacteroidales bacterium]|nr:nucleoside recognition domain-containing protein [Bacteroidales bacterium]